jgi:hypothetical protein
MDMRWKIFYTDGTTFSNQDGEPEDAPGWGVIAVAQEDDVVGVQIHHQRDFYCFAPEFGGWYAVDYFGFAQYLARPGLKVIKVGDVMPTNEYLKLIHSLHEDPELPTKSARYSWERQI